MKRILVSVGTVLFIIVLVIGYFARIGVSA
jgi:hypothetical protein